MTLYDGTTYGKRRFANGLWLRKNDSTPSRCTYGTDIHRSYSPCNSVCVYHIWACASLYTVYFDSSRQLFFICTLFVRCVPRAFCLRQIPLFFVDDWVEIIQNRFSEMKMESDELCSDEFSDEDVLATTRSTRSTRTAASTIKRRRKPSARVTIPWIETDIIKLIGEVEARSCIWDAACEENKSRADRHAAWQEIAVAFDHKISVEQLSVKWQTLRTQFRKLVKRNKIQPASDSFKPPNWKFYPLMAFISSVEQEQNVADSNVNFVSESNVISMLIGRIEDNSHCTFRHS